MLVTGAGGLLGCEVVRIAGERGHDVIACGREDLDVTDAASTGDMIASRSLDWVVHCAAYTAVDRAEREPEEAMRVNRDGTRHILEAAERVGARMTYVSTDYVFDGAQRVPYRPTDPVRPLSAYGRSKAAGEAIALEGDALVARTGWLYGSGGNNFVRTILGRAERGERLRIVDDQTGRPTWSRNLARSLLDLVERRCTGVWHVADGGEATWLELAEAACEIEGVEAELCGVSTEEWGAEARRPAYSVLDLAETEALLGSSMEWRVALTRYLAEERE